METLGKLFGSETKVKIMKLFLFNPEHVYSMRDIAERVKSDSSKVRKEILVLEKIGLMKRRVTNKNKTNGHGFVLDPQFPYLLQLQNFLVNIEPLHPKEIVRKINKIGTIKLVIISGVFIQETESRVDILIVGDGIRKTALENTIKTLESEIGKELKFAHFTTEDFQYRLRMFDKLTRDILDYPHRKVLNRLGNI